MIGSTQPYGSLVVGEHSGPWTSSHVSPWSHERMTFSNAMKKMHPLEVTPILGSGPSSPTSLKLNSRGNNGTSTGRPSGPVTKNRGGSVGTSTGGGVSSWPKQPEREADSIRKTRRVACARMFTRMSSTFSIFKLFRLCESIDFLRMNR